MSQEKWAEVRARYMTDEQLDEINERCARRLPADFDQTAHNAKWQDLNAAYRGRFCQWTRPAREAQAFLDEWQALIEPWLNAVSDEWARGLPQFLCAF